MPADDASSKENVSIRPLDEDGYAWLLPEQLPDAVRRQLFWVIKRHSSYTAWARAFAAFDAVINKMESLLPELAAKPFGTYGVGLPPDTKPFTIWPGWEYKLKWRCEYRAALARLRRGTSAPSASYRQLPFSLRRPNAACLIWPGFSREYTPEKATTPCMIPSSRKKPH